MIFTLLIKSYNHGRAYHQNQGLEVQGEDLTASLEVCGHQHAHLDDQYTVGHVGSGAFQKIKFAKFADKVVGYNLTTLILCTQLFIKPAINTLASSRK